MRRDVVQRPGELGDEMQRRLVRDGFVFVLVAVKPVAIIVALEASQKTKKFGSKVSRHGIKVRARARKSKAAAV